MEDYIEKLNIIPIFFRKHIFSGNGKSLKFIMFVCIIAAVVALIHGSIKEGILSSTSIIIILITLMCSFIYFNKLYRRKIFYIKNRLQRYTYINTLDKVCSKRKNRRKAVCRKYSQAKGNFKKISNLLLQKY